MSDTSPTQESQVTPVAKDIVGDLKDALPAHEVLKKAIADKEAGKTAQESSDEAKALKKEFGDPPGPPNDVLRAIANTTDRIVIPPVESSQSPAEEALPNDKRIKEDHGKESTDTLFDTADDAQREPGELSTTQEIEDWIKNADVGALHALDNYLRVELHQFQIDPTEYLTTHSPEDLAKMVRAQELVQEKVRGSTLLEPAQIADVPSSTTSLEEVEPIHSDSVLEKTETVEAMKDKPTGELSSEEKLFLQGESLIENMNRGKNRFNLETRKELEDLNRNGAEISAEQLQALYADSLSMAYLSSELLIWSKSNPNATQEDVTTKRNELLIHAVKTKNEEDMYLSNAQKAYNKQQGYDENGGYEGKLLDIAGLGRFRKEKKANLHEYTKRRADKIAKTRANLEELVENGNSSEVDGYMEDITSAEIKNAEKLAKELGISPWWVTVLLLLLEVGMETVKLGNEAGSKVKILE